MPARWAARVALLIAVTALAVAHQRPAAGQAPGTEKVKVTYVDRKDGKTRTQEYDLKKESAAGLEVQILKDTKLIPSSDIQRVDYYGFVSIGIDQITAGTKEEADDPAKAAKRYADLQKNTGLPPKAIRYLKYREAASLAKIADAKTGAEFKTEAEKVVKLLTDFTKTESWEAWAASRQAARYQLELGDYAGAARTLASLAANKGLTKELVAEAKLAQAAALIRAEDGPGAADLLKDVAKDVPPGPLQQRLTVLQKLATVKVAEGSPKPKEAIELENLLLTPAVNDPTARSIGYGLLGHLYRKANLTRDAMWALLWVDVVNPQDKDEQVLAVRGLIDVFDAVSEKERSDQYKDKLPKVR